MLIKNIKHKYYDNLLDKLLQAGDVQGIKEVLENIVKSDFSSYQNIILKYIYVLLEKDKFKEIFKQNLLWINTFNKPDSDYLSKFIFYIINKNKISCTLPNSYAFFLNDLLKQIKKNNLSFQETVDFAYFYQFLITRHSNEIKIINSSGAFFETAQKRYFTHYNFTKAFFYVVRNPLSIFKERKMTNRDGDVSENFFGLLSADTNFIKTHSFDNNTIEENTQNWPINVSSWAGPNVTSTFRGFVIKYEDLTSNPKQIFAEVVGHLVQSGLKINLNYQDIDDFIRDNPLENKSFDNVEVSNKELKLLRRDLGDISKRFGYEI